MASLPSDLRKVLENAVVSAREQATTAAGAALKRLAVATKEYPQYLSPEETVLRRNLRAAARQLGDRWNAEKQSFTSITKIIHEVAYEHWHRMLFARFLAENNLLMHPDHGVSVDLATVAELAQEEANKTKTKADTWAMAGRFASKMLSRIFRPDDPALAVQLAPEHQQALEKILESLPPSVFIADDSLGWVYQFWQSAEKERVNNGVKAGDKITGETLPAVTQLFTEHYMVLFLLHNTVGAWWAGRQMQKSECRVQNEAEARVAVELPGYSFDYLRFVPSSVSPPLCGGSAPTEPGANGWKPAAGVFAGWPATAREIKLLDPCCGSGHFLVAGFELLARLRMAEEGSSRRDAAAAVIADNLYGLELDPRCTQIAAFNVALAAWKFAGDFFPIDSLHIACSGLAPSASEKDWLKLADAAPPAQRGPIRLGLTALHRSFADAPEIGSLIQIGGITTVGAADYETLQPFLINALASEDEDAHEQAITAQGMAKAAQILAGPPGGTYDSQTTTHKPQKSSIVSCDVASCELPQSGYTLVITNVPYLGRGKQSPALQAWADEHQPDAKADLATLFISRSMNFLAKGGTLSVVSPQNWLFLTTYKHLRARLLKEDSWNCVARLGSGAFETISGEVVNVALVTVTAGVPSDSHIMAGIDVSLGQTTLGKAALLCGDPAELRQIPQAEQIKNPDARIAIVLMSRLPLLADLALAYIGQRTGDVVRFGRSFWELDIHDAGWVLFGTTIENTSQFGGNEQILLWEEGKGQLCALQAALAESAYASGGWKQGWQAWLSMGVRVSQMGHLPVSIHVGCHFDNNSSVIVPTNPRHLAAIWAYCASDDFHSAVRIIDQSLKVTNASLTKVPFDLAHWQAVAAEKYPNGLPEPESDDPTQWLFHGRPEASDNPLQVAVARLLGYRWPAEVEDAELADVTQGQNDFPHNEKIAAASKRIAQELKESRSVEKNAAASKRIAQELKESLSVGNNLPASKTIAQELKESPGQTKMRLSQRARDLVARCGELSAHVDDDGVVPLVAINGEPPGDQRVRALLEAAYGDKWTPGLLNDLLSNAGSGGSGGKSLEDWLKNDFFAQHCSLFHQRPFIWQIWDGKKDGFNILVNYHRLCGDNSQDTSHKSQKSSNTENVQSAKEPFCDVVNCDVVSSPQGRRLLEKIVYTYLGDWITQQQAGAKQGVAGADTRLKAAQDLQKKLEAIITGEPPFDIFVRWKPLHEQPIGWNPDINDGVRMNIRPFITAGVLRAKVNVKWTKDRGKEPASIRPKSKFPWFWKCPEENPPTDFAGGAEFSGERLNNLHYTIKAKQAARAAANSQGASHKSQRSANG